MSIELPPLLLASASSLLPESLGAITGELSLGNIHSLPFWMLLVVTPTIFVLVILGICQLGGSRIDDESGSTPKLQGEAEPDDLTRFIRDTIQQLNGIAVALRDTIPEAGRVLDQERPATKGLPRPDGRIGEGSSGTATQEEGSAERVGTLDETAPRTDPLPLGSVIETMRSVTHDKALAQLAAKMHKLTELANRMQEERLALEHNTMDPDGPAPSRHYLTFSLGDEQFAVSTLNIHGVVEATQLVAEPSMPPKVRKAIKLHGGLVPVIDLGARFGGQAIEIGWSTRIILLEVTSRERLQIIGVVVDTVGKVLEIAPTDIQPPAAFDSQIRNDFALGTATLDNRPVTLLDIGRGLSAHELVALRSAARSTKQENEPA